jgi:hypothetical protein
VGRPAANRRGTFKKASNLNYQLAISQLVATRMKQQPGLTAEEALEVVWEQWGREFVAQGDLTMDDDCLILLIDADTKVRVTLLVTTCYMCAQVTGVVDADTKVRWPSIVFLHTRT